MIEYLNKIPEINDKQAKEDDRTVKIQNSIDDTKRKIADLQTEIKQHKEKK